MVEFNKHVENEDSPEFPIRMDKPEISESESRLRAALERLAIVWDKKEELAHDTANHQYADGVESCLEDLKELLARNAIT